MKRLILMALVLFISSCATYPSPEVENNAEFYYNRGVAWQKKGDFDQAISDYSKAIELRPEYADAYIYRGESHRRKKKYTKAISDFTKAIEINPRYAEAYAGRGEAYARKRQFDQAISDCNKAIDINPACGGCYNTRGLVYYLKAKYDETVSSKSSGIQRAWEDVHKAQSLGWRVHPQLLKLLREASKDVGLRESPKQQETSAIRECFYSYREAALNERGSEALSQVNEATIQWYAQMQELALYGQELEVRQLSTINKMTVLRLRHSVPVTSLRAMGPRDLFVYGVNNGWVGKSSLLSMDIGNIETSGRIASAEVLFEGRLMPIKWLFTKEDGSWKIDLTFGLLVSDQALKQLIKQKGLDEDDVIFSIMESVSGKKVSEDIWQPLIR